MTINAIQEQLTKFWEVEEGPQTQLLSEEEQSCETHYTQNTRRDSQSGRYTVRLPVNAKIRKLGDSYTFALGRLRSLERA